MQKHRTLFSILILVTLVSALVFPGLALAQTNIANDDVTFSDNIKDDLFIAGENVELTGNVDGDVYAAGQNITISGDVTGNIFAAGQKVEITGNVGQTLFVAGENITYSDGTIGNSFNAAGARVNFSGEAQGDFNSASARLTIAPETIIGRDANVAANEGNIDGTIGGDLNYSVETANVNADVAGTVTQSIDEAEESAAEEDGSALAIFISFIRTLIGWLIFAALLLFVFPKPMAHAYQSLQSKPGKSALVGFLVLLLSAPVILGVLALGAAIGGWWIAFIVLAILFIMGWVGFIVTTYYLSVLVFEKIGKPDVHKFAQLALGLLVLSLIKLIPILGGLVICILTMLGLGATLRALWLNRKETPIEV